MKDLPVATLERRIIIDVEPPAESEPPPDNIEGLRKGFGLKIPGSLVGYLERNGIRTLADIRRNGGLGQDPALPVPANQAAVRTLDSLAALSLLPTDIKTNGCSERYDRVHRESPDRRAVVCGTRAHLVDRPRSSGRAEQDKLRRPRAIGIRRAAGLPKALQDVLPQTCGRSHWESALGPIPYTMRHVRNNGAPVQHCPK
jgi:hypothetical protein